MKAAGPVHYRDAIGNDAGGRVAVIVGAGGAMGRALAAVLASQGVKLVLADADPEALEQVTDELGGAGVDVHANVLAMVCDVRRRAHVEELADAAMIRFHGVHVLVNGAPSRLPSPPSGAAWELDESDWDAALGTSLQGAVNAVRAFTPLMLACAARDAGYRGHIVNVLPQAGNAGSAVAAQGILALSDALESDLRRAGAPIGVAVLRPDGTPGALAEGVLAALAPIARVGS
jgi:NAD(P)-dependent dehydrogenase (short-subunit alcohol dehydrogenase family)